MIALLVAVVVQQPASPRLLDGFEMSSTWSARPADGVALTIRTDAGYRGRAMRLDFAFQAGAGYAIAHRDVAIDLPDDYELSFYIRGETPDENLEVKLIDSTGDNVWWVNRRNYAFPRTWRKITLKKRQLGFAWGPAGGGELHHAAALEFAITAGSGGRGTVWIDELTLTPRAPEAGDPGPPRVRASSAAPGSPPSAVLDGDSARAWRSGTGDAQWLVVDFRRPREYGGLVLFWDTRDYATQYSVQVSDDGRRWDTLHGVSGGNGGRDYIALPETESRYLRLSLRESSRGRGYRLRSLTIEPLEFGATPNDFFRSVARAAPHGVYPKYFTDRQSYWTVVGASGGTSQALLNEEGLLEAGPRVFSIEPFLLVDGSLVTWSDVTIDQGLASGDLPVPWVRWRHDDVTLTVTAFVAGPPEAFVLYATYRVENAGVAPRAARLYLAVRPFQVNPPWQFLGTPGGVGTIHALAYDGRVVRVDRGATVVPLDRPSGFGAATFDEGEVVSEYLERGVVPWRRAVRDPAGYAAGALVYELTLLPGASREIALGVPLATGSRTAPRARLAAERTATEDQWRAALNRVSVSLPTETGKDLASALRTTLAYLLIERDGPALRPGTRSYARAWIRDGALISRALLQLGHSAEVRDFITWYARRQYANGKVPCCVDARGSDPVPEHDSNGEFLYLIAEYGRFTGDTALVREMWPRVDRAVAYLDSLRHAPAEVPFRGLLPPSISHEGYSAKPMHSYWDDFWALRGFKDAAVIAGWLGQGDSAARYTAVRDSFRVDVLTSLGESMAAHHIEYLPGAADLGDFDATSTAIALAPVDELAHLPREAVRRTFDRYYDNFVARRGLPGTAPSPWDSYTPYEMRVAGTFVRLGQPDRARELLAYFLGDRRPRAWNEWGEVVWRDAASPKFVGDMPHAWVGAEFIRSVLDLFAYERESDSSLVVGAGLAPEWVTTPPGMSVHGLRTVYGTLDLSASGDSDSVVVWVGGTLRVPPGGVIVSSPVDPTQTTTVRALPAELTFRRRPTTVR
jgi:F5/8 type C domain